MLLNAIGVDWFSVLAKGGRGGLAFVGEMREPTRFGRRCLQRE